ncbi:MAG: hypothetical protein AAGE94_22030 [Acidobacteriota bacterium]
MSEASRTPISKLDIASGLMLVAAVAILLFTFLPAGEVGEAAEAVVRETASRDPIPRPTLSALEPLDAASEGLFDETGPAEIWALFVVDAEICPTCLNEVSEFLTLLDQVPFERAVLDSALVVLDSDRDAAFRFMESTALPMRGVHAPPTEATRLLGRFTPLDVDDLRQQLVFFDPAREKAFYRVLLSNYPTEMSYKTAAIGRMLDAFDSPRGAPSAPHDGTLDSATDR